MAVSKKTLQYAKFGLTAGRKKNGINLWRCFFNGIGKNSGTECMFYIELELLNPNISTADPLLGFKPRVTITEDDLQYALAGTEAAQNLQAENIVQPSYYAVRVGKLSENGKQICAYHSSKDVKYSQKPFSIKVGNKLFSENKMTGFIKISEEEIRKHPEYMCEKGFVSWNLTYDIQKDFSEGYKNRSEKWFPCGLQTKFSGVLNFDGEEFIVEPKKSYGYMDRYYGKTMPEVWFHISSANLTSNISGKMLFDSAFAVQGSFENRVSFLGSFEGADIIFNANSSKRQFTTVWNCVQTPENEDASENKLHWSLSINSKMWVIDVDLFCTINELFNRTIELPDGHRKVLNVVQGGTGVGEIKLFKRIKNSLEQIEYAKIAKAVCEFGHAEEGEI
ncbi:MAG: hypothetical protein MJ188_03515 [Treponema sp.]|nr:hypothetical protein [Treponema sp.]